VVISLDDSPNAWYALDWALSNIVQPATDHVVLLSVAQFSDSWKDLAMAAMGIYLLIYFICSLVRLLLCQLKNMHNAFWRKRLKSSTGTVRSCKISQEIYALKGADVRELIVDFCSANQVDLLIVGSRGLGAMKRTFLGSVSDYCLKNSECPVLVIK
ncbi:hypothetical protein BKA69DRAFT_1019044, partial [Paraphysoderma sedebokerense]